MRPLHELLDRSRFPTPGGAVVIIGGPPACPGAVVLAATAALRFGVERVHVAVDPAVAAPVGVSVPEVSVHAWEQRATPPPDVIGRLRVADAVLIGSGHASLDEIVVRGTAERVVRGTAILDASALGPAAAVARGINVVIAPSPSEALTLVPSDDTDDGEAVPSDEELARALLESVGQPVAVRGAVTVIADGECYRSDDPPPGISTPGSSDVFMGVLAAVVASGLKGADALAWATFIHLEAGRRLPPGYLARELADEVPRVIAGF